MQKMILNRFFTASYLNYKKFIPSLIIVLIGVYVLFGLSILPHICIFEVLFRIKCSFCGITSAYHYLFSGNLVLALNENFLSVAFLIYLFLHQVFYLKKYERAKLGSNYVFLVLNIVALLKNNLIF